MEAGRIFAGWKLVGILSKAKRYQGGKHEEKPPKIKRNSSVVFVIYCCFHDFCFILLSHTERAVHFHTCEYFLHRPALPTLRVGQFVYFSSLVLLLTRATPCSVVVFIVFVTHFDSKAPPFVPLQAPNARAHARSPICFLTA